jgi:glucan 1,4-alpha-glucosidase
VPLARTDLARTAKRRAMLLGLTAAALVVLPAATASHTPSPSSVTIAGSLQSELGCPGDWQPDCSATHLTYDAGDDVWQRAFSLPVGSYEYKAALNDSWTENYGRNAQRDGANIPLALSADAGVKFYYDHKSHWVTDNKGSVIAVAPGSFQSELGCPGDWDPGCLRSWLQDPDGDGIHSFETTALPAGSYETKVAINESWDENYGQGGVLNGPNIPFTVPVDAAKVAFTYNATSHVLTVTAESPQGAPDGPGALSHFGLARKDCLGTARNTTSKVWYTIANGVLSDVYYPTIDTTNVETLQYVVTDGSTFTDLQTRDMTYTVQADRAAGGMACTVTATARSGKYRIVTDYVTDPDRNALLMRVKFKPKSPGLHLYTRLDATVNGNGGGGPGNGGADHATIDDSTGHPILVSFDPVTETNAANRDYAEPVFAALDGPFSETTSGFVGAGSDGLVQLDADHSLTKTYADALGGNVVQTARVGLTDSAAVLALGFGASGQEAVETAEDALGAGFAEAREEFAKGWRKYDRSLKKPRTEKLPGIKGHDKKRLEDEYYLSANVIKASEDKTFPGAIVASLASPWGQAVSAGDPANTYFGSYREVFARDLYESWTGLVAAGDVATARNTTLFLFERQQLPDGSMPRNSLVNGKVAPDSFGTQLDETAYPILMAYQLGLTDASLYEDHIKRAANFVAARGAAFGVERWEEQSGFSPSTIAAEIAGLVAAAELARANGDTASAAVWLGVADAWQRRVKGWTVTTNGPLASRYFIRLSKTGDPNAAISYNVGNGGPTLDQREVIDAGFLELVRLGELPVRDRDVARSLEIVDATIRAETVRGPGWHRYNGDGYGDRASDGRPWAPSGQGTGHLWPALSAERGEQKLASGKPAEAASLLLGMSRFASGVGLIPEQNWELPDLPASPFGTDPTLASIGFVNGGAAGSASPLTWSAASFVRLTGSLAARRNVVLPAATHARYVAHSQGETSLTVTSPADNSSVGSSPVTVTGTTARGNTVYIAATNTDANSATTLASARAADGSFSIAVDVTGGTNVLNVVAVSPSGATAHERRTVLFDFVPGTLLLDVSDPDGDDDGPGNYAYPTFAGFHPGAFDIQRFQVYDSGTNVTFRLRTRDLTETFGSPLGAQLVDVYVRIPGALPTSTAAAHPLRNFTIAPSFAWSRLIQVQGFGQRYVDASGNTVGTASISANPISRFITFSVPKASLGTPGPGWGFTVVLAGQDGFSPDQARGFASTPQEFQFGVCSAPSSDPHCTFDPSLVPKAVDVITGPGVDQSTQLDYTLGPVVLTGVAVP